MDESCQTGKASTIYVQTRDQFGNNLRFTNAQKPCTGYPLSKDTCDQQIDYQLCRADEFQVCVAVWCNVVQRGATWCNVVRR